MLMDIEQPVFAEWWYYVVIIITIIVVVVVVVDFIDGSRIAVSHRHLSPSKTYQSVCFKWQYPTSPTFFFLSNHPSGQKHQKHPLVDSAYDVHLE